MAISAHTFWLPRRGHSDDEYEDASAVNDPARRYAVADGASEGCFTDVWARLLVEDFAQLAPCPASDWPTTLPDVQQRWDADVRRRDLPWHADQGIEQGAFAAFLGVAFNQDRHGSAEEASPGAAEIPADLCWKAVAVGDVCLFHTRNHLLLRSFPLDRSNQFSNTPQLVGVRMSLEQVQKRRQVWEGGQGQSGDRLWAMTDALAQWCLTEVEENRNPWAELELLLLSDPQQPAQEGEPSLTAIGNIFSSWIDKLRQTRHLRNDDVTLVTILL